MASYENVVPGVFKQFSNKLASSLRKCIPSAAQGKVQRWSTYHHLISSKQFQDGWALFLKEMGTQSSPTLYQFVTMQLMDVLIKQQFQLPAEPGTHCFVPKLSTAEENALWYVAGYVVRHTREKIESTGHAMQEALLHGLDGLSHNDTHAR